MKHQFLPMLVLFVCAVAIIFLASRPPQDTFDKISVREFELVDKNGKKRASIKVEENNEVVFRLRDQNGTIRVKLGADEEGSGLLLLDSETNPGIHALAKNGANLIVTDKDGKKKSY